VKRLLPWSGTRPIWIFAAGAGLSAQRSGLSRRVEYSTQGPQCSTPRTSLCLIPALLLTLAGCSLAPVTVRPQRTTHLRRRPHTHASTVPTNSASAAPAALASPTQPVSSSDLPPPADAAPAVTPPAATSAAPAAAPPGAPSGTPSASPAPLQLVGLSRSEVRRLLGPPTASSTKGAAVAWIYRHAGCTIEIAFYYDVTRNRFFALSQRSTSGGDAQACVANAHNNHAF
jgi:hypothetical protein